MRIYLIGVLALLVLSSCSFFGGKKAPAPPPSSFGTERTLSGITEVTHIETGGYGRHFIAGNEYLLRGMPDEAITEYKLALEIEPRRVDAELNLAIAYLKKEDIDVALSQLKKVLEIEPDNEDAHYVLALIHLEKGDLDEAITELKDLLNKHTNDTSYLSSLGEAFLKKKWLAEAIQTYKKALALNPFLIEARLGLIMSYGESGLWEAAVPEVEKALELYPELAQEYPMLETLLQKKPQASK